jgi:hypothetical protein
LVAGVLLLGCAPDHGGGTPDAAPVCGTGFLGDPSKPVQTQVIAVGAGGASSPVSDGSTVALLFPPQGGRVIFAGVRATNIDPCGVKLSGALRDPVNNEVRVDVRTVNLGPTGDGWGSSTDADISSFANVPICPNQWSQSNAYGSPYDLTVTVTDKEQRTSTTTLHVTLSCAEPDKLAECLCLCKAGYVLGESCDAGAPNDGGTE